MKKWIVFVGLACMAFLCCQREEIVESKVYRAVVEGFASTKTVLDSENKVLWSKEDQIALYEGNTNVSRYQVTTASVGKTAAEFVVMAPKAKGGNALNHNIAIYPFQESFACASSSSGSYLLTGMNIPATQKYVEASFDEESFPMAAVSALGSSELSFMNICGVIKLQLKGKEAIRKITIKGNDGESLSGSASVKVYADGTAPSLTMDDGAGASVTLDCGTNGVQLKQDAAVPFLITLPPTAFAKGFTVTVTDVKGGHMEVSTSKKNTVSRSGILRMPVVEYSGSPAPVAKIESVSTSYSDIKIKVTVNNYKEYCGSYCLKSAFDISNVLRDANWKKVTRYTGNLNYEGSLSGFPDKEPTALSSGQTYVVWVAPYGVDQKSVTADDIVYKEFTVPSLTSGGSSSVTVKSTATDLTSVSVELSASGAEAIYTALLTSKEMSSLTSSKAKINHLLSNGNVHSGTKASVSRDDLSPGTSLTLLAFAVDSKGRYGSLLEKSYKTATVNYNESISIALSSSYTGKTGKISVTATGGNVARYYYFAGKVTDSSWKRVLGGTKSSAEQYISVNKDNYIIINTDEQPLQKGCIVMEGLEMGTGHVVVIMAEDTEGRMSRAFMHEFVPTLNLGKVVTSTGSDKTLWSKSKPSVKFGTCYSEGEFYVVNWAVTPASGMTAYAVCAHPNAFEGCTSVSDNIVKIFNLGDKVTSGKMQCTFYGDKENYLYVTWCDADGNFYEPYSVPVPQE